MPRDPERDRGRGSGAASASAAPLPPPNSPACPSAERAGASAALWHRRIAIGGADASALVLVAFADHADCPWLRVLRPGFRHCFAVVRQGPLWLTCEALKDRFEMAALELPPDFDLAGFYAARGYRILVGRKPAPGPRRAAAPVPLTCVSVVKRLLGVRASRVWTPWQLHRHLLGPEHRFLPWYPGATEHLLGGHLTVE